MLLKRCSAVALRGSAVGLRGRRSVSVRAMLQDKLPVDPSEVVGERIGKWISTPFDLLAFPARAGAGALVSMPERLQTLQLDVARLVELAQDPRSVEEKQDVLRKEFEATMVDLLEKGVVVEQDVLSNLKTVLPPDAANALTELIPEPPNKQPQYNPDMPQDPADFGAYSYATGEPAAPAPTVTYGQQDVISVQIDEPRSVSSPPATA